MMTEDLSVLFNDFGSEVVFGLSTFKGIFDRVDRDADMLSYTDYHLTIKTSDSSSLAEGSSLSVDGVNYVVRGEPKLMDDGKLTKVGLARP